MADSNFDVVVDLSMDDASNKEVLNNAKTVEQAMREMESATKRAGTTINQVLKENDEHFKRYTQDVTKGGEEVKQSFQDQSKAAAKAATAQAQVWSQQGRILTQQARLLQTQSREYQKYADGVGIASRTLLIAGTAVSGGIFKAANDFIKNAPQATALTVQWQRAQDSLNNSYSRFGQVAVEAALPLLEKAAELAGKAADFVERNPGVVSAALNVGLVTAGLGAIGILVSKGIRLQADLLYIQSVPIMQEAANINMAAAEQMLIAAQLNAEAKGIEVADNIPGGGGVKGLGKGSAFLGFLGDAAVLLGSFAAGLIVADKAFDSIQKHDVTFNDYVTTLKQTLAIDAKNLGDLLEKIRIPQLGGGSRALFQADTGEQMFRDLSRALGLLKDDSAAAAKSVEDLAGSVRASPAFEKVLGAYEKYRDDDLKLVQNHYATRQQITSQALADEIAANQRYASESSKITSSTTSSLIDLHNQYEANNLKAEQKYYADRAKLLQDAGDDVKKIEEDLQETLRKNALEHKNKDADLLAARDAVGLRKEAQRYTQQQAEERRQANLEIAKRRQDLGKRLQEMEAEFVAERQARYQEYIQRSIEIRKEAQERLNELRQQHLDELRQIRIQAAAKLREEDSQFNAERRRRYDAFIQQIRDLDASLLGERQLRQRYQDAMINDLDAFLAKYKAGLASINSVAPPGKAEGGYVAGLVHTGEKGYEWIATHASVKAAEQMIGGRLTQGIFLQAMRALQAGGSSPTYIDQRRMEAPLSREQKAMYEDSALGVFRKLLGDNL